MVELTFWCWGQMLNEAAEHEITVSGLRARYSTGSQVEWGGQEAFQEVDIWTEAESSQEQFTTRWVEFIWKARRLGGRFTPCFIRG